MRHRCWIPLLLACLCGLATACRPANGPATPAGTATGAEKPAEAVRLLTRHLRDNDFVAFARDAVPPELHARLDVAWRAGRTRWPLDELPLGKRLPSMLAALAKPGSEARLQQVFDRQFARADREIKSTASTLGLFAAQFVRSEGDFSEAEREHYPQLITAVSGWAQTAPLSDPTRAHAAIAQLAVAARKTGLASDADFARLGMEESLRRMSAFAAVAKQVLAGYGLDLDASLDALDARLQSQTGDSARVRMRYAVAGRPIDTLVEVERHDGRWYLGDHLHHAEAAVKGAMAPRPMVPALPAPTKPGPPARPVPKSTAPAPASA